MYTYTLDTERAAFEGGTRFEIMAYSAVTLLSLQMLTD